MQNCKKRLKKDYKWKIVSLPTQNCTQ